MTLLIIYFFYGLSFFAMGLAVALESRRASLLALGHHLRWLAAFGLVHSLVEWSDMFQQVTPSGDLYEVLAAAHSVLLPFSALLLVRFGIGLVGEAGPLPAWLELVPPVLLVPGTLLVAFAIVVSLTAAHIETATDIWSRYLLYLPGNVLAAVGFARQWRSLRRSGPSQAQHLLLGAALAFGVNAVAAGLIVPQAPYGLAPWLNYDFVTNLTGAPVQVWRMVSAIAITGCVVGALGVFEAERHQQIERLQAERAQAQQSALKAQSDARQHAETWIDGLVAINRQVANLDKIDDLLGTIIGLARRLLASDTASLGLWDETHSSLQVKCYATPEGLQPVAGAAVRSAYILESARSCRAMCYPEDFPTHRQWMCPVLNKEIVAAAIVPLRLEERPVGAIWMGRYSPVSFTPADLIGLERLADQAVIALEHAMMAARLQSLAVMEERSRIAREMHDSLAQILGYLSLQTQTLEALVKQGDQSIVLCELKRARDSIRAAQDDVRESILSLRTTLSGDFGLIQALRRYVEEFGVQTGIRAVLIDETKPWLALSPLAETQLVRIVQEALTNVRKHARARQVEVRMIVPNSVLHVIVTDDGIGIQDDAIERSHFGLQTMRERAESIGGSLLVSSIVGEGTQVEFRLPLENN